MNPLIELNKYPLPKEQVEPLVYRELCSVCGDELKPDSCTPTGWKHVNDLTTDMYPSCWGNATPASKVSAPAEPDSEATSFAQWYVSKNHLQEYLVEHIAHAYLYGKMDEIKYARGAK